MLTNANSNVANVAKFSCESCEYITNNKNNYKKHCLTLKHLEKLQLLQIAKNCNFCDISCNKIMEDQKCFECNCGRKYSHISSLSRHKKECGKEKKMKKEVKKEVSGLDNPELVMAIMKDNQEFKAMLMEQHKYQIEQNKNQLEHNSKMIEYVKECKVINNNNCNNVTNKFNMNIFLNEKCANALNIMDFISQLQLQLKDLESVGQLGYMEGISKIFIRGLKELDVTQRPIHCSDLKRETMYIKDNNEWEKDNDDKNKMKKAIQHIAHKNLKQISEWKEENPEYEDVKSKKNEQFMTILSKACGGANNEEDDKNYEKIIKNVAKQVLIDK
jgi:hypothetical protein